METEKPSDHLIGHTISQKENHRKSKIEPSVQMTDVKINSNDRPVEDIAELNLLLDLVLEHRNDLIQQLLRDAELPVSGSTEQLRDRLRHALDVGRLTRTRVIDWLDNNQGWGNQHVYLYEVPDSVLNTISNREFFSASLQGTGLEDLLEKPKRLLIPNELTFTNIQHENGRLRCVSVIKRVWFQPESSSVQGEFRLRRDRVRIGRAVFSVDVNLTSGICFISIPQLERGRRHSKELVRFRQTLKRFLDVDLFTSIDPAPAIPKLRQIKGVRGRRLAVESDDGLIVGAETRSQSENLFDSPKLDRVMERVGKRMHHHGDVYLPNKQGNGEVHIKIHADDKRVAILGQQTEEDARHVIELILKSCR